MTASTLVLLATALYVVAVVALAWFTRHRP